MLDKNKVIQVSELMIRIMQNSIDTNTIFRDFDLFERFDKVEHDLWLHEIYSNLKLSDYKHELNYPNETIEKLEKNLNGFYKLIMLKHGI